MLVASSLEMLNKDKGDLWDSGKVASSSPSMVKAPTCKRKSDNSCNLSRGLCVSVFERTACYPVWSVLCFIHGSKPNRNLSRPPFSVAGRA